LIQKIYPFKLTYKQDINIQFQNSTHASKNKACSSHRNENPKPNKDNICKKLDDHKSQNPIINLDQKQDRREKRLKVTLPFSLRDLKMEKG
jgi:hypothetical protein